MPIHYLTLKQIGEKFSAHINKKELKAQSVGTTITLNSEQIMIISDEKFSKENVPYEHEQNAKS